MSSDIAGHLMWHRLDPTHPAHRPGEAGDELVQVYEAVDAACGRLIEQAEWLWDEEPTVFVLSDHGMKPTHWLFRANRWLEDAGYLRFREDAAAHTGNGPAAYAPELEETLADEQPPFAEIDFGATRAYCFGYGGQIYLGEVTGAEGIAGWRTSSPRRSPEIPHPESGEPAFDVSAEGGALPRLLPRQGAGARPPTARRAHPRRLDPPALERDVPAPRAPVRPGNRALLGPARGHGHPGRRRARNRVADVPPGSTSRRFLRRSSPSTASRPRSTPRRSRRSSIPAAERAATGRRGPADACRAAGYTREEEALIVRAPSRPRLRVAQGRPGGPEPSHVSSTGPRSTSRSRPGSRSRPVGSTSGRSSRRGSTPRPRSSTRAALRRPLRADALARLRVECRFRVAPDAAPRLAAQVLARPAGAPAGVGRAEEVAALEVGATGLADPSASGRAGLTCPDKREHPPAAVAARTFSIWRRDVVVASAFESSSSFSSLMTLSSLVSSRPFQARGGRSGSRR